MGGNHSVRCECTAREGLFRVTFDPEPPVEPEPPVLTNMSRVLKHVGFTVAAAVAGGVYTLVTLALAILIP
eukprot:1917014-Rhodomonas_salina.1